MRRGHYLLGVTVLAGSVFMIPSTKADTVTSYVGYSGDAGDNPTITPGTLDGTAGNARSDFLNVLGNKFYYEDFQELSTNKGKADISSSGLALTFNPYNSPTYAGPATASLTSTDALKNSNYADVDVHQGPIGNNERGTFDTYEGGLNDAYSSEGISDTLNQYVDISNQGKNGSDYTVTITVSPGYDALGLLLNDVVQPSKTNVEVTFSNGTTETMGALNAKGNNPGTLSTNNTWFLGIVNSSATITSVTIGEAADGDPIDLDNIYLGDVVPAGGPTVPLPASALGGGALMGLIAVSRRRARIA